MTARCNGHCGCCTFGNRTIAKDVNDVWNTTTFVQLCVFFEQILATIWFNMLQYATLIFWYILNTCCAFLCISLKQVTEKTLWKGGTSLCPWLCINQRNHPKSSYSLLRHVSSKQKWTLPPWPRSIDRVSGSKPHKYKQIWVRHRHAHHFCSAELLNCIDQKYKNP